MDKRISVKTIYLLLVISIGLIGLGVGSTYAVFTARAEIDSPIVINSNLTHDSNIMETVEIEVSAKKKASVTFNISNTSVNTLNYAIWYLNQEDVFVGTSDGIPTGSIVSSGSISVTIDVVNTSSNDVTVILGIASGVDAIVLGSDMIVAENYTMIVASDLSYDNSNTGVMYDSLWNPKNINNIALLYASDYGYAADLSSCNQQLYYYDNSSCVDINWISDIAVIDSKQTWLLTHQANNNIRAWCISSTGRVSANCLVTYNACPVFPVLYLKYNIGKKAGDGSVDNPYQLLVS